MSRRIGANGVAPCGSVGGMARTRCVCPCFGSEAIAQKSGRLEKAMDRYSLSLEDSICRSRLLGTFSCRKRVVRRAQFMPWIPEILHRVRLLEMTLFTVDLQAN